MKTCRCLALALCAFISLSTQADEPHLSDLRSMELKSIDGSIVSFADAKLRIYCVLGTECPVSRFYAARLDELSKQYADQGVRFVGIHSNMHDSKADVQKFMKELCVSFPQVHDTRQAVARQLRATRVPEVFLLDAKGEKRYSGRVDDQYVDVGRPRAELVSQRVPYETLVAAVIEAVDDGVRLRRAP